MIETAQSGVVIEKSDEKVIMKAGLLPRGWPVRKLKVYVEAETIEVEESTSEAFEELKVVAVAATEVLRCMYSLEDRFQMKASVVGVSDGGRRKPVHVSLMLVGLE